MLNLRRGSARLETQRSNIGFAADYVTFWNSSFSL
jgi:hypothetical protein